MVLIDESIMIDRCVSCGFIWLDADEFPAVAAYVLRMTGKGTVPLDVEELLRTPGQLEARLSVGKNLSAHPTTAAVIDIVVGILSSIFS